jgi:hypothetical protein
MPLFFFLSHFFFALLPLNVLVTTVSINGLRKPERCMVVRESCCGDTIVGAMLRQ